MTSAIGYVVHGINLQASFFDERWDQHEADIDLLRDMSMVTAPHSGRDPEPCFLGVQLCKLHEGSNIDVSDLQLKPSPEEVAEFEQKVAEIVSMEDLSDGFRELIKAAKPTTFITWGTT